MGEGGFFTVVVLEEGRRGGGWFSYGEVREWDTHG